MRHGSGFGQHKSRWEDNFSDARQFVILLECLPMKAFDGSAARQAAIGMQDKDYILMLAVEIAADGVLKSSNFLPLLNLIRIFAARGKGDGG